MNKTVILVEDISKQYRLGKIGTGTFSHDLNRWWHTIRGKEDPYLKIGEVNDRTKKSESEYVWALKNISFEVKQGEVLGIIGRNGAGKSTLLKILSRTTLPTTGSIKIKGRVASLLEVGTGFHPELTGRENIYLNGAILGMTKQEIRSKYDEIVDFSGIEKYINTPVKRYSSGMYVRLAFAVAAHLEPEILIVDEVLAVGDFEFQKKCLGKMKDVSSLGRTVLFVSHDLGAMSKLCSRVIMLNEGKIERNGNVDDVIKSYLSNNSDVNSSPLLRQGTQEIKIKELLFKDMSNQILDTLITFERVTIEMICSSSEKMKNIGFAVCFNNIENIRVTSIWSDLIGKSFDVSNSEFKIIFEINCLRLIPGEYQIITFINWGLNTIERIDNYKTIRVKKSKQDMESFNPTFSQGIYVEDFVVSMR